MTNIEFYKKDVEREISNGKSVCLALNEVANKNCWDGKVKPCLDYVDCYKCSRDFLDWLLEEYNVDWSQVEHGTKCLVRDNEDDPWFVREFALFAFGKPWFFNRDSSKDDITSGTWLYAFNYYKLKEDED